MAKKTKTDIPYKPEKVDNPGFSKDEMDVFNVLFDHSPYASFLDKSSLSNVTEWIDTGSKIFNALISGSLYKGVPVGRMTLFGGESTTGKSYLVQSIAGNAQKMGKKVIIFDSELAIDQNGARNLGLDPTKVAYAATKTIKDTRNVIFSLLEKIEEKKQIGEYVIIIDSIANMISDMEYNRMSKDNTSADMGSIAKDVKSLLKTCISLGGLTKTTFLVTNHLYDNPTEMYPDMVKHMNGGKACRYLPSVVVQLAKKNLKEKDSGEVDESALSKGIAGVELRAMCVKNRFIRAFIEGSIYLSFKQGLNDVYGSMELAKDLGVLVRRGSVYDLYDGTQLGYAGNFKNKTELWEDKIYPEIEKRLTQWEYSSIDEIEDDEIPPELDDDDDDDVKIVNDKNDYCDWDAKPLGLGDQFNRL